MFNPYNRGVRFGIPGDFIIRIAVRVKPNSRVESIDKLPDGTWVVRVHAPPQEGRANEAVTRLIAKHFGVSKSAVAVEVGGKGRNKIISIAGVEPS
ncbi:MAG: DUF167 domain-containing protein [Planctomycetes bacterium]|nr:DUF167 domain-containing protein [Planctomycetota bacterium]